MLDWLVSIIYYVVPFLVLLGILVFVHEFGHYIVAKLCGVAVSEFSVGFGKEIWGRDDKSGTHWKISLIPLGGYCKFLGDADASSSTEDEAAKELSEEDKKRAFPFQKPQTKLAIVFAGPAFNYLFAILVYATIFFFWGKFDYPPVVGGIIKESAAEAADIRVGDRFLKVNGNQIKVFSDIRNEVTMFVGDKIEVVIDRGGEFITKKIKLKLIEVENKLGEKEKKALIGVNSINAVEIDEHSLSLFEALKEGTLEAYKITVMTLRGVGQMIRGERSGEDVGGIIRIAELSGDISKKQGILDFCVFMALLSVNLGLINLFPIPILDGGHIIIYLIEIVTRREMPAKFKDYLFKIGLFLIIALMLFATWNDFVRLFVRWFS